MRVLRRRIERVLPGRRVVLGDRGARLHGVDDDPVVDHVDAGDMGGILKGRVGGSRIAQRPVQADIARRVVPDQRRAEGERAPRGHVGG